MKLINFRGNEFHLADTQAELKTTVKGLYFWEPLYQTHHIFGRIGILKMLAENNLPVSPWVHGLQKSMDMEDRRTFDLYVQGLIGEEMWDSLEELAGYIKNQNPLYRG